MSIIETLRAQLAETLAARAAKSAELDAILAAPETEARDLNETESVAFTEARDAIRAIDADIAEREARIADLEKLAADKATAEARSLEIAGSKAVAVRVGREELTYRADGQSFLTDAFAAQVLGDFAAGQRIARHQSEMEVEYRAVGTGAFTGLVVPQYLTDQVAPYARAGRPFADALRNVPLPADGMTVNISRITTGSTSASQSTENSALSNTDIDDTLLTINVRTVGGVQDVSRQAIERGTGVDTIVLQDLVSAYATELDRQLLNGSGSSGEHKGIFGVSGINSVTYTDASPTAAELYPKIADAIQQINTKRFMPANLIVMHPRRWMWLLASVDSQSRPLVVPTAGGNAAVNAFGTGENAGRGIAGSILGVPVLVDANVVTDAGSGTNEDKILVTYVDDSILWEQSGSPLQLRFDQTLGGQLTIKMVVFGYSASAAGARFPGGVSVISGTGLVTPSF